jgi:glycosyltransferase involved in cell wall biosynthesis
MKLLVSLLGAQSEAVARAIELGKQLRGRGHSLDYLGNFAQADLAEIQALGASVIQQISNEPYDAMLVASLGGPERLAQLARRVPTVLLVQESMLDLMSLKGDFVHWVSLFRAARGIVFMTEQQRDKVFASFVTGLEPSRLVTLACGAPAEAFAPRTGKPKDFFGIAMSAPVVASKYQQDLISAGERLRDFNLIFTFIGDNSQVASLPEGIRKIIERHPERYVFTGAKTGAQTLQLLRDNDLYCHTSSDEGWSQAVINAAAIGLPLMLSEIDAFAGTWINGVNCLKFPISKPDFLASSLRMILQDDVLRASLGQAAQNTAKRYSADRYASVVTQLLESTKK